MNIKTVFLILISAIFPFFPIRFVQSQQNEILNNNIPSSAPGFVLPKELGEFKIDIYTETVKKCLPNEDVKYSAIWYLEKKYLKRWEDMTEGEKNEFVVLKNNTITALSEGVKSAEGELKIEEIANEDTHMSWRLSHPDNSNVVLWNVNANFLKHGPDGMPELNIYVAHTEINRNPHKP